MPVTVGGGVSSEPQVRDLLRAGADKVSINTAALRRPGLVDECAARHGSQCIVVAIDAKAEDGGWRAYESGGRRPTRARRRGVGRGGRGARRGRAAGHVSMDTDGTGTRLRARPARRDPGARDGAGDRLRRRRRARPRRRRAGRRLLGRAGGLDLPRRHAHRGGGEGRRAGRGDSRSADARRAGRGRALRRRRAGGVRLPGRRHRRGADGRLAGPPRRWSARWRRGGRPSGAARAASCGRRARRPATCSTSSGRGWTATATRCCWASSPRGPACHTGSAPASASRRRRRPRPSSRPRIAARRDADPQESYTARFLHGPREHAARKVGEEAVEVLLAPPGSPELAGEIADLWFHSMLLLARDGVDPLEPLRVLLGARAECRGLDRPSGCRRPDRRSAARLRLRCRACRSATSFAPCWRTPGRRRCCGSGPSASSRSPSRSSPRPTCSPPGRR